MTDWALGIHFPLEQTLEPIGTALSHCHRPLRPPLIRKHVLTPRCPGIRSPRDLSPRSAGVTGIGTRSPATHCTTRSSGIVLGADSLFALPSAAIINPRFSPKFAGRLSSVSFGYNLNVYGFDYKSISSCKQINNNSTACSVWKRWEVMGFANRRASIKLHGTQIMSPEIFAIFAIKKSNLNAYHNGH